MQRLYLLLKLKNATWYKQLIFIFMTHIKLYLYEKKQYEYFN